MRLSKSSDFKKGQIVYLLVAWNFHLCWDKDFTNFRNIDYTPIDKTKYSICKLEVHSSGKKVIKFLHEGKMVNWQDYFWWFDGYTGRLYFETEAEAIEAANSFKIGSQIEIINKLPVR